MDLFEQKSERITVRMTLGIIEIFDPMKKKFEELDMQVDIGIKPFTYSLAKADEMKRFKQHAG